MADPLDRLLADEQANFEIAPSSGFVASTMEAVRQVDSTPAPIPFPWARAWLWFVGAALALGGVVAAIGQGAAASSASEPLGVPMFDAIDASTAATWGAAATWTLLGLALALAWVVAALRSGDWLRPAGRS